MPGKAITVYEVIQQQQQAFAALLPREFAPDRFVRLARFAVALHPDLQRADQKSLLQSLLVAARLGLDPSGTTGAAYLVPYRQKQGPPRVQLIIGYKGLIELVVRSGLATAVEAHVVYENDTFELEYGTEGRLRHKPAIGRDRGEPIGAWAMARLANGAVQYEYMTRDEIEAIRRRSRAGNDGPWVTDWTEMAKKTVVRRLIKYLPYSAMIAEAAAADADTPVEVPAAPVEVLENEPVEEPTQPARAKDQELSRIVEVHADHQGLFRSDEE